MIAFYPENHKYISTTPDQIEWISVSKLTDHFKEKFDPVAKAQSSSQKPSSMWYGMDPEEIVAVWEAESQRSVSLGNWYHNREEQRLLDQRFEDFEGTRLPVFSAPYSDGVKVAGDQKLQNGIYPEHMVYLKEFGVCGQSDKPIIHAGKIHIRDYKTSKEIKRKAFPNQFGRPETYKYPLNHLEQCDYNKFALQLSTYAYIIRQHNPDLKVGSLMVNHVTFEEETKNRYGYPVTKLDSNGDPIIKEIVDVPLPYLELEVTMMLAKIKHERENKSV